MSKIVDDSLLQYLTNALLDGHIGTLHIGPKRTEDFSQYYIELQWSVIHCVSFRIADEYLILRLDTIPKGLYYREWWWKIGHDITYKVFRGYGENQYMNSMFFNRRVDCTARICPNGLPESEAARGLDVFAHRIGTQMKLGLSMRDGCMRIVFRRWVKGYGLGYITFKKEDPPSPKPDPPRMLRASDEEECLNRILKLELDGAQTAEKYPGLSANDIRKLKDVIGYPM